MSKTCQNCGNIFEDDVNICPRCGTQYIAIQSVQPEQTDNGGYAQYQQPQPQPQPQYGQYQQPQYMPPQQPYQPPAEQPMGVGAWLGTILLTSLFGIISLVLLFVWAFGTDVPTAKRNYCRAMLILELIGVVLSIGIILLLVFVFANSGVWDEIMKAIQNIGDINVNI